MKNAWSSNTIFGDELNEVHILINKKSKYICYLEVQNDWKFDGCVLHLDLHNVFKSVHIVLY